MRLAYQFAMESDLVRADGIEATEFPDLAEKFRVFAVPRTIINEGAHIEGSLPEGFFLDAILKALGPVDGIASLPGLPDTTPGYYNLILLYDKEKFGASRTAFVKALLAEGIPIHMFYVPLQRWPIFAEADFFGQGCPFLCPKREGGPADYRKVSTPTADALCDDVNLEIKVQPTSGETEMKQVAEAVRKIAAHKAELKEVDRAIAEGRIQ